MSNLSTTKAMSWSSEWEKKFIRNSALRVSRMCPLFLLAIALFELGNMLYVLWYTNFSLGTRSSRVYFHLYAILFSACLLCLLLLRLFAHREKFRQTLQVQGTIAAVLPSAAAADCDEAGGRLCRAVESPGIPAAAQGQPVTISIGCAVGHMESEEDWDHLLRASDRALYQAKFQGKNRFFAFQTEEG